MSNGPPPNGQSNGIGKTLMELLVVTLPPVFLYFTGWVYLYYYLDAFGVSVSELNLDLQTIFLYGVPPFRILFISYWLWIVLAIVAFCALMWLGRRFGPEAAKDWFKRNYSHALNWPSPVWIVVSVFLLFLVATLVWSPVIQIAALQNAGKRWEFDGIPIRTMISQVKARDESILDSAYRQCSDTERLELIFSDRDAYYLLCKSTDAIPKNANVFEIRRKIGLVSMRSIQRAYSQ